MRGQHWGVYVTRGTVQFVWPADDRWQVCYTPDDKRDGLFGAIFIRHIEYTIKPGERITTYRTSRHGAFLAVRFGRGPRIPWTALH